MIKWTNCIYPSVLHRNSPLRMHAWGPDKHIGGVSIMLARSDDKFYITGETQTDDLRFPLLGPFDCEEAAVVAFKLL